MAQEQQTLEDTRSLHRPAWDSSGMGFEVRNVEGIEGKHVFLKTRRGIFVRAYVTKETRETIFVRYVKKSHSDTSRVVKVTESVKKSNIYVCRVYKD